MGGEKWFTRCYRGVCWGSPPRGRGKVSDVAGADIARRITPAWAGKREQKDGGSDGRWDHPRVGGEKSKLMASDINIKGSPPRGRGKAPMVKAKVLADGITPAWAGKSKVNCRNQNREKDHPRVGGEKCRGAWKIGVHEGSPPRGRGKADADSSGSSFRGITPAWAGKSIR